MSELLDIVRWFQARADLLIPAVAHIVLLASIIVKLTPTLKDDAYLKPVIKFIGKYVALDKYSPPKTGG